MNLTIKKSLYIFIAASSVVLFGCKKQLDINVDPNYPLESQGSPKLIFPAAVMSTVGRVGGELNIIGGIWSQYYTQSWSSSQYRTIDAYNLQSSDYNGSYSELFSGGLNNYQYVLDSAKAQSDWNYFLMATVMKAYTAQVLVDLYDKIPYSQALQGKNNLNPAFDDGYTIYTDLLNKIDEALGKDFTAKTNTDPGATDLVFGGDMDQWKKFANTLKLKMYLRMVNAKPAEAKAGIEKLYSDGAEFLDGDAGVTGFTETPDKQNPFYGYNVQRLNTTTNLRASKTFVSWLLANGDPRVVFYFNKAVPDVMHQGDYLSTYGRTTVFAQKPTDPVNLISTAESYFMQAEARLRYFSGDNTEDLYNQAVINAFTKTGNKDTARSFVAPGGAYEFPAAGNFDDKLEAISVQKWVSMAYGTHSLEAFFERNRTGYPKASAVYSKSPAYIPGQFVYSPTGVTGNGAFPKRLVYPNVERSRNKNTPPEVPITTPVWWAK